MLFQPQQMFSNGYCIQELTLIITTTYNENSYTRIYSVSLSSSKYSEEGFLFGVSAIPVGARRKHSISAGVDVVYSKSQKLELITQEPFLAHLRSEESHPREGFSPLLDKEGPRAAWAGLSEHVGVLSLLPLGHPASA